MKTALILCSCAFLFLCLGVTPAGGQNKIDGTWVGTIEIMGQKLEFATNFKSEAEEIKGTMDIPMQGEIDMDMEMYIIDEMMYMMMDNPFMDTGWMKSEMPAGTWD